MTFLENRKSSQQMTNFVYLASIVWRKVSWSHRQLKKEIKYLIEKWRFHHLYLHLLIKKDLASKSKLRSGPKRFRYYFVLVTIFFTHGDTLIRKQTVSCQGQNVAPPDSVLKNWDLRISNESVSMKGNGINKLMEGSYCHFKLKSYASQ